MEVKWEINRSIYAAENATIHIFIFNKQTNNFFSTVHFFQVLNSLEPFHQQKKVANGKKSITFNWS